MNILRGTPREIIQSLYEQNGRKDPRGAQIARNLDADIGTLFSNSMCFLNEILQNADDQAKFESDGHTRFNSEVNFSLMGSKLIFYHSGKPFNEEDVRRICDYKNADENQKSIDSERTGYKDIGFKSVFKIASRVEIWSQGWNFHFDEYHPDWRDGKFPWPIIPIWTEKEGLSEHEKKIVEVQERTTFIFTIRVEQRKEIVKNLKEWADHHSENILFLRYIEQVHIDFVTPKEVTKDNVLIRKSPDNILQVSVNGKLKSQWLRVKEIILIENKIRKFLEGLKACECPARLKGASEIPISFVYRLEKQEIARIKSGRLFCTLPIGAVSNLPFHVNAPFLLNSSRESLLVNRWNRFLIEQIAILHFDQIKRKLAERSFTALRVLAYKPIAGLSEDISTSFNKKMKTQIENQPFVPSLDPSRVLKIEECVIDQFRFHQEMLQKGVQAQFRTSANIVHPELDQEEFFRRFKVKSLTLSDIIKNISKLKLNVHLSGLLLDFFSESRRNYDKRELNDLKGLAFIWTRRNIPAAIRCDDGPGFYLSPEDDFPLPDNLPILLIHRELETKERIAWLIDKFRIRELIAQDILDFYANCLDHESLKSRKGNLQIIHLLFDLYVSKKIKLKQLQGLRGILLHTTHGTLVPSYNMYLSDVYDPGFKLHASFDAECPDIFVNEAYLRKEDRPGAWKDFFLSLGVRDECQWIDMQKVNVSDLKKIPFAFIDEYLEHVFTQPDEEYRPAKSRRAADKDDVFSFVGFPYIQFISKSDSLCDHFWKQLKDMQKIIINNYNSTTYRAKNAQIKKQPITYLQYIFQFQELIKNGLREPKRSGELYAPSLGKKISSIDKSSIAHVPVELSEEMEIFLGFRMIISLEDCCKFLKILEKEYNHQAYQLVMSHLLIHANKKEGGSRDRVSKTQGLKFIAFDGTWRKPEHLKFWAVPNSAAPYDSRDWIKEVLPHKKMEELCDAFNIEKVTKVDNREIKKVKESAKFRKMFEEKLPFIAYRLACHQGIQKNPGKVIERIVPALDRLKFYEIELENPIILLQEDCLYLGQNWESDMHSVGKVLGQYLKFEKDEINVIIESLLSKVPELRALNAFNKALTEYRKEKQKLSPGNSDENSAVYSEDETGESDEATDSTGPTPSDSSEERPPILKTPIKHSPEKKWTPKVSPSTPTDSPIQKADSPSSSSPKGPSGGSSQKKKRKIKKLKRTNLTEQFNELNFNENKDKGNWAEEHTLHKLIAHCISHYQSAEKKHKWKLRERRDEGEGKQTLVFQNQTINFLWYNDPALKPKNIPEEERWDSGNPFDIEITWKQGDNVLKRRQIEVKGTEGSLVHFFLSANEFTTFLRNQDSYRLYAATKIGLSDAKVKKYKDIIKAIAEGLLIPFSSSLQIKGTLEKDTLEEDIE